MPESTGRRSGLFWPCNAAAWVVAGCLGWHLRGLPQAPAPEPQVCASTPLSTAVDSAPLVQVGEGLVELHPQRTQLARVPQQAPDQPPVAGPPALAMARPAQAQPVGTLCRLDRQAEPQQVSQSLSSASEEERWRALVLVRGQGLAMAEQQLRRLFEGDSSARVRLAAFDLFMERLETPEAAHQAALYAASALPYPELQQDALQRLREMAGSRLEAAPQAPGVP